MFSRHEELYRNEFRVIAISPRDYRPTRSSPESRDFIDEAYLQGEKARAERVAQSACPYAANDPSSHNWRRGWMGARLAEVETPSLEKLLKRAGLVASRRSIDQLDGQHRFELVDWLEAATDQAALEINRPNWVQYDPQEAPHDSRAVATTPRPISFAIKYPLACAGDVSDEEDLPRLREQPPATREESLLQDLLRQFDDLGVQLVEEQWQSLSGQDQDAAIDWLNDRLAGQFPLIPPSLFEFATTALQNEPTRL